MLCVLHVTLDSFLGGKGQSGVCMMLSYSVVSQRRTFTSELPVASLSASSNPQMDKLI